MVQASLIQEPAPLKLTRATRVATPLLMGIVGPSGQGKTYSALRLATGMRRVTGGDIGVIDTESGRALHYAPLPGEKPDPARGKFDFQHLELGPPFESLRYLEAIRLCANSGCKVIVIDSMSHEHEGIGGVLEKHDIEAKRLAVEYKSTPEAQQFPAWGPAKAGRKQLKSAILTDLKVHVIFCFRSRDKTRPATTEEKKNGSDKMIHMGYSPIADSEFLFEMMTNFVFLPGSRGVPAWQSNKPGEREFMKLPDQFVHLFEQPAQLSEELGQQIAEWAAGGDNKPPSEADLKIGLTAITAAKSLDEVECAAETMRGKPWSREQRKAISDAVKARKAELAPKS